ncbi:MAG: hypothetical protein ACTSWR_04070 [Candidatus Helarchaeota archaeon]
MRDFTYRDKLESEAINKQFIELEELVDMVLEKAERVDKIIQNNQKFDYYNMIVRQSQLNYIESLYIAASDYFNFAASNNFWDYFYYHSFYDITNIISTDMNLEPLYGTISLAETKVKNYVFKYIDTAGMELAIDSIHGFEHGTEINDILFRGFLANNNVWIYESNYNEFNLRILFEDIINTEEINVIEYAPFPIGINTLKALRVFNQGMVENFCDPNSNYYWIQDKTRFKGTSFRFQPLGLNNYIDLSMEGKLIDNGKYIYGGTHFNIKNVTYSPTGFVEFYIQTCSPVNTITSLELYYDLIPNSLKNDAYVNIKIYDNSSNLIYDSSINPHPLTLNDPPISAGGDKIYRCRIDLKAINNTTPIIRGLFFSYK